jgi:hypothetical protein
LNKKAAVQKTRFAAFSLTQLTPQRYRAVMRTLLLPLAVVALLALVGPSRAKFDSAGNALAKDKAPQSTGVAFDRGMSIKPPVEKSVKYIDDSLLDCLGTQAPQPVIKNPSNIPRPKR